ncbi:hypothetical protein [Chlamydia pecorum]|uniref:hypothetical protein n=1 Tax=Chlamydia pecorum TaxID=85991 RepID=UPI0007AF5078|nr:hypothetical protein [Chlamydia pecorum]
MKRFENILASGISQGSSLEVFSVEQLHKEISWDSISQMAPRLPRGWFELMGLSKRDRLDFFKEYWSSILSLEDNGFPGICRFFSLLETLEVYIFRVPQGPFEVKMFYIFEDGRYGFHGEPPLINAEERNFPPLRDTHYQRFFSIHDGFGKWEDEGILSYRSLVKAQQKLRQHCESLHYIADDTFCSLGLFPFYGYEEPLTYQCFLLDPEVCRNLPSPNIRIGEKELEHYSSRDLEVVQLCTGYAPSFLSWLEGYVHSEEEFSE